MSKSYYQWRIYVTAVDGSLVYASFSGVGFYASNDGSGANLAATRVGESQSGNGEVGPVGFIFDGTTGTEGGSSQPLPYWVSARWAAPVSVGSVSLSAQRVVPDRTAKDFIVQGSDDGVTWFDVYSKSGETGWVEYETRVYSAGAVIGSPSVVLAPSPSVIAHGGGSVSIQSPLPLMSAGIEFSANSDLQCPSPLITVLAGGTVSANSDLQCPSPLITVLAGGTVSANSDLQCPSPLITVLAGGTVSATAPPPRLLSIARDSTGDYAASLTAPRPTLTAFGAATARATAPKPTLASGGTVVAMGSASVASPSVLVQSEGRVSAMVRSDLRAPSASLIGYGGAVVSVTLSGKATVEASGTTGGIAGASLECPLFQLSAEATAQNYGSASLIAPSPEIGRTVQAWVAAPAARLTAIGTAVVTATFDTYVVNLLHRGGSTVDEVTHYTNFPFTHVVRYQNSYYGVNGTGLYLLEGTTDDGDPIEWAVQTAMEDFGSPRRKTVDSVYIEGRLGAATTVSLQSGEKTPNTYSHTTPRGATAQNHRQKLGRGVKERYHALGLAGDGEFELDAVEFNERETNRRI